jgi:hypothetical protein
LRHDCSCRALTWRRDVERSRMFLPAPSWAVCSCPCRAQCSGADSTPRVAPLRGRGLCSPWHHPPGQVCEQVRASSYLFRACAGPERRGTPRRLSRLHFCSILEYNGGNQSPVNVQLDACFCGAAFVEWTAYRLSTLLVLKVVSCSHE